MKNSLKIQLACAAFVVYAFVYLIFSFKSPIFAALFWINIYGLGYYSLNMLSKLLKIETKFIVLLTKSTIISVCFAQIVDCFHPISHNYFACIAVGLTAFIISTTWYFRAKKKL